MDAMELYGTYMILFTILFGLSIGSFLNVCIWRLPNHESIVRPGSHCPKCGRPIIWYDNIPVLSFLILGGKCRHCKEKISLLYPLIEILNACLWTLSVCRYGLSFETLFGFVFSSLLLYISAVDIRTYEISNTSWIVIFALSIIKFLVSLFISGRTFSSLISDYLLGAFSGSVLLLLIYFVFLKVMKKEVVGGGDVKLTFACGAFLGWKEVLFGIGLSAYVGLFVILILVFAKKFDGKKPVPYGPFLSTGFLVSFLYFKPVFTWYVSSVVGL